MRPLEEQIAAALREIEERTDHGSACEGTRCVCDFRERVDVAIAEAVARFGSIAFQCGLGMEPTDGDAWQQHAVAALRVPREEPQ